MADGWHSRGCGRCRDPDVFGEASRAANGPALQLGAIKPDRCVAGGGGLLGEGGGGKFPAQFDTDVWRAGRAGAGPHPPRVLPWGWGRAAGCWGCRCLGVPVPREAARPQPHAQKLCPGQGWSSWSRRGPRAKQPPQQLQGPRTAPGRAQHRGALLGTLLRVELPPPGTAGTRRGMLRVCGRGPCGVSGGGCCRSVAGEAAGPHPEEAAGLRLGAAAGLRLWMLWVSSRGLLRVPDCGQREARGCCSPGRWLCRCSRTRAPRPTQPGPAAPQGIMNPR